MSLAQSSQVLHVLEAYLAELERGVPPHPEELLARHPDLAEPLKAYLASLDFLHRAALSLHGPPRAEPAADEPDAPGRLGDFRIVREIGRGGMGLVYEAEQISLGRRVALKVLPFAVTMDPRQLQRFQNEARAAASLEHPHIVPVHAVGSERGVHYYAMKFIEGQTLAAMIAAQRQRSEPRTQRSGVSGSPSSPLTPLRCVRGSDSTAPVAPVQTERAPREAAAFRQVAEWGIQAAEALEHAHSVGIVHRDIKPANLMVDAQGKLWVTDFGLARTAANAGLTRTGDVVGTLRYMSPEQALAKHGLVDHRTDVYSLGATLYELLTLQPAYGGKDREELMRQIAFEEPRPPRPLTKTIPVELETIVLKALEKNPAERYATAKDMADDLRRFLMDEPIRARRPSLTQRARKWARRHHAAVRATVAVLIMAVFMGGGLTLWLVQKKAGAEGAARAALVEASELQEAERWIEALSAAKRAQGILNGVWADQDLRQQVDELAKDLEMAHRLEEAHLKLAASKDGPVGLEDCQTAFAEAFAWYGLDVDSLDAHVAAERIRSSSIQIQLAAGIDEWAVARSNLRVTGWKRLLAISREADPDPLRLKVREALETRDTKTAEELIAAAQSDEMSPATAVLLARLTAKHPDFPRVMVVLRRVQRRYPANFWINFQLGSKLALIEPPQLEEAIRYCMVAKALRPRSYAVHFFLGLAFGKSGQHDEAIAEFREAIYLDKKAAPSHMNLGNALRDKHRLDDAVAEYREAIRLGEHSALVHCNLGNALADKGELDEAIAQYQEAIRVDKTDTVAHYSLADALFKRGELDKAISEYREAIRLKNDCHEAHCGLGGALHGLGQLDEAAAECREAIRLKKDYGEAHTNLGACLSGLGKLDEAIAEYQEGIRLKPEDHLAHNNFGNALRRKGQLDQAIAELRETIRLKPDFAEAHANLGLTLSEKGQFREAVEELRRGQDLGSRNPHWPHRASLQAQLQKIERLMELDAKLPNILGGQAKPADSAERIVLAQLCYEHKKLYVAAFRFYAEAFANQPQLVDDLDAQHRYSAACIAALAGCGHSKDAHKLNDAERACLRHQGFHWLRADLARYAEFVEKGTGQPRAAVRERLRHWQQDTDFAGVRSTETLALLPEVERAEWTKFWQDVATLAKQAAQGEGGKLGPTTPSESIPAPKELPQ